jgi:PAS domain S-box-containing protein
MAIAADALSDHLDWSVGIVIPESAYLKEINQSKEPLLLFGFGLIVLIAGAIFLLFDKRIRQPILTIAKAAAAVEVGKFDAVDLRTLMHRTDEIGQLARIFQAMAEEVETRERFLKAIVEDQTESICRFLPDGTLTFVNDAYCRYIGQQQALIGQNFIALMPEQERPQTKELLVSFHPKNAVKTMEVAVGTSEFDLQWQQWTIHALFDIQGQLIEFQAVGRDITRSKQAEMALLASEARYRALVEQIPAVTYIASVDDLASTLYISPQIESMLGYSQAEWLNHPGLWSYSLHAADRDRILSSLSCNLSKHNVHVLVHEYRMEKRTGETIWVQDGATVLLDEATQSAFLQGVMFDITERKQTEAALQKLNAELELRVKERTDELRIANQELDAQANRLKASLEEKELLLKEIHHRVKNNMQVISSIFSLQSQYVQDPQVLAILTESRNRISSMALIHEKLYQCNNFVKIDFAEYIQSLTRNLFTSYDADSSLIQLTLDIADVALSIDSAIPCGLLTNELISNCLKHAFPEGKAGKIAIALATHSDNHLTLMVRDSGIGLPSDFSLEKNTSLGLRLVKVLTRQLSGQLEMYNDGGTIARMTFPIKI